MGMTTGRSQESEVRMKDQDEGGMGELKETKQAAKWTRRGKVTAGPDFGAGVPAAVELHIEELVLHGFAAGDRYRIANAVEHELARLMGEGGPPESLKNPLVLERIDGGAFNVKAGLEARAAGTEIAQAVYRSLRRNTRASASAPAMRPGAGVRHR